MEGLRAGAQEPDYWGHIEAQEHGLWRWPYAKMKPGDWFTVSHDDKPVGTVRQGAYQAAARLRHKFEVKTDGETITVICRDQSYSNAEKRSLAEQAADKAILAGGDGDKYLGVLQPPPQGRWSWPYGVMKPGQFFHVSHDDRHPERVRQTAMVRAAQLAMKISVRANDPDYPGHARIEFVDVTTSMTPREFDWAGTNLLLKRCYGVEVNDLAAEMWTLQDRPWESMELRHARKTMGRVERFIMKLDYIELGFELKEDAIIVTGLPKGTTYDQWLEHIALS